MNDIIIIPLYSKNHPGHHAIIDAADAELVCRYQWFVQNDRGGHLSARASVAGGEPGREGRERGLVGLHRFLMNAPEGIEVDHRNHNALDCRRSNLRLATRLQNARNRKKNKSSTSPYKGVLRRNYCNKWEAYIYVNNKRIFLGSYVTPKEAAHAYDDGAREHHGEFASLNFPEAHEQAA